MTPAEYLEARYAEEQAAAEALRSEHWGHLPWAVIECSFIDEDGHSQEGCPCIVYQGEYKPFDEAQVPGIQYVADAETPEYAAHIATWDPARILAEVEAKRAILAYVNGRSHQYIEGDEFYSCAQAVPYDESESEPGAGCSDPDRSGGPCDCGRDHAVKVITAALLTPYRTRPDFNPEWA